jgi:hypothetical protein
MLYSITLQANFNSSIIILQNYLLKSNKLSQRVFLQTLPYPQKLNSFFRHELISIANPASFYLMFICTPCILNLNLIHVVCVLQPLSQSPLFSLSRKNKLNKVSIIARLSMVLVIHPSERHTKCSAFLLPILGNVFLSQVT